MCLYPIRRDGTRLALSDCNICEVSNPLGTADYVHQAECEEESDYKRQNTDEGSILTHVVLMLR
jgi:hypothetical protein